MKLIITTILCAVALSASSAFADVVGLPWSTWGEVSYSPDSAVDQGTILNSYAEQGVDWLKFGKAGWILDTFAGLEVSGSDHAAEYWNNKIRSSAGVKVKRTLELGAEIDVGIRGDYLDYFHNPAGDNWRAVAFIQWSANGDWKVK